MSDRVKELEAVLDEAIDYVKGCIGSSYCETGSKDLPFLHHLETIRGTSLTPKSVFY